MVPLAVRLSADRTRDAGNRIGPMSPIGPMGSLRPLPVAKTVPAGRFLAALLLVFTLGILIGSSAASRS